MFSLSWLTAIGIVWAVFIAYFLLVALFAGPR